MTRCRVWLRFIAAAAAFMAIVSAGAMAQDESAPVAVTPIEVSSIPAARQADRVAIITVEGVIDPVTSVSVQRRIKEVERGGFDAFVLEVNSPGGELFSCLKISQAIKASSIKNTVAWVNNEAHSGGAIISLACGEIVTNDPSSFGDALIVNLGPGMMRRLTPDERTKALPPLMTDVVDSARRFGYDEYLVQAIVTDGIELWQVEHVETGERLAINEAEYRMLFDGDPIRGRSMLVQITGGTQILNRDQGDAQQDEETGDEDKAQDETGAGDDEGLEDLPASEEEALKQYRPASDTLDDIGDEIANEETGLALLLGDTQRVMILPDDKGSYRLLGYLSDGSSAIVMRTQDMQNFGLSSGVIRSDEELKAFFGAKSLTRTNESVFEKIVRFLTSMGVRYVLIAIFLLAIGVEMLMGGTGIAGAVSLGALALLIGPGLLLGLNGWWEIIAIVSGLICIAIEIFVMPGFGVFGILGFVLVFGGLIGTFVSAGGSMSSPQTQQQLMYGTVVTLLAMITAGVGWWLTMRNLSKIPLFEKLIPEGASGVGGMPQKSLLHAIVMDDGSIREGLEGVTTTMLCPLGQAQFGNQIADVHAAFGSVEKGTPVRVVRMKDMRIEVEPISDVSEPTEEER